MKDFPDSLIHELVTEIGQVLGYPEGKTPPNLDKEQVATILDVTPSTLDVWACTGRHGLQYFKTGRKRRYRTVAVARHMASNLRTHTGQAVVV